MFLSVIVVTVSSCSFGQEEIQAQTLPSQQEMLQKNALLWKNTVVSLYNNKEYAKLKSIDDMGKDVFKDTSIWKDKDFLVFWDKWSKHKALLSWEVGNGNLGMWKVADGNKKELPTMGLKREQNGQWWLVFVKPQNINGSQFNGWNCNPRCNIKISSNGVTRTLVMRPPQHQEYEKVHTIGVVAPKYLFTDQVQLWEVSFPDKQTYKFDVSFAPSVCDKLFGKCDLKM